MRQSSVPAPAPVTTSEEAVTDRTGESDERKEMLERTAAELKEKVGRRESIPGYEYRPKYGNWFLALGQEHQTVYPKGGRHRFARGRLVPSGPKQLYVASQETMFVLIDEAVERYRAALAEYEEKMEACRAVEQERTTFSGMVDVMKKLEEELMASDLGKQIDAFTHEMSMWHEEYDGDLTEDAVNQVFTDFQEKFASALPADMHMVAYEPLDYPKKPPTATVEWQGRTFKVALCNTDDGGYGWWTGFSVQMPELPQRPVVPSLLENGKLVLNHKHPAVEIRTL